MKGRRILKKRGRVGKMSFPENERRAHERIKATKRPQENLKSLGLVLYLANLAIE